MKTSAPTSERDKLKADVRLLREQVRELLKACEKTDDIAADLASMAGVSSEGRAAQSIGEKLHKLVSAAIKHASEDK